MGIDAINALVNQYTTQAGLDRDKLGNCLDFALDDGTRIQMTLPPLVENPILTIHVAAPHPENLDALVPDLLSESAANLIQESLCNGDSMVVVSKSYRSDPNHTLGALASSIPDSERIISLCPATRLKLTQPQALSFNAPDGQTSMENLLSHALSIKPGYIVLGDHCSNTSSIKQMRAACAFSLVFAIRCCRGDWNVARLWRIASGLPDLSRK